MRNHSKLHRALQDALAEFLIKLGVKSERVKDEAALAVLLVFRVVDNYKANILQLVRKFPARTEAEILQRISNKYARKEAQSTYSPQLQNVLATIEAAQTGKALLEASLLGMALPPYEKDIARIATQKRNAELPPHA